jgi:hypothetical protein
VGSPHDGYGPPKGEADASFGRREFTKRAGIGTAAAAGIVWAAPKISTIKYATKAAAGSRPPGTTTTATVPTVTLGGEVTVSATSPCVGTDVRVNAAGFAAGAGVAIQIDSAAIPIGMVHADARGAVDALVSIPTTAPTGPRSLRVVGPKADGTTLALTAAITIKTAAECATDTGVGPTGTPVGAMPEGDDGGGGSLPLTGSDAIDLAVIGGAAAIGGRVLYGMSRRAPKSIDGSDG